MKLNESFMVNFRWITPLVLAILSAINSYQTSEIRALRLEVAATRQFSMQYTDKMIDLVTREIDQRKK